MTLTRIPVNSPVGQWMVEGDTDGVSRIYMPDEKPRPTVTAPARNVTNAAHQIEQYFARRRRQFDIQMRGAGTEFQVEVWLKISAIPYGEVRTYQEIAAEVGRPHAYRAVGNANNANPWPIVVPCHRVVAINGLGGYAGGLDIKRFLLEFEGAL